MKNNQRLLVFILVLVLLLGITLPVFAVEAEKGGGQAEPTETTQAETYVQTISIESVEDLLALTENCRLDTWSVGKKVVLKSDISLNQVDFQPIPSFSGLFDGNGHTISDLQISGSLTPAGLFGQLQAAGTVKNLTVSGVVVPSGDAQFVGGIVGENYGTIVDCTFTGSIAGSGNTGGVAGINALSGKISGCEVSGTILGSDMTGGIAGCNLGMIGDSTNKACINTVSVDPTIDPSDINFDFLTDLSKLTSLDTRSAAIDTGGIAGYSAGIVQNCKNKAAVGYPHIGYNVGGIAGRNCGYLHDCTNAAEIFGRKDVGGIVGQVEPYVAKNLDESTLAQLQHQLDELGALVDETIEHTDHISHTLINRLNEIADSMEAAASAIQEIQITGTISSTVTGNGESNGNGSITITPIEGNAGGEIQVGDGSVSGSIGGSISNGVEGEANGTANGTLDAQTQINISVNLSDLASALSELTEQMRMLNGELGDASDDVLADIAKIRTKISEITQTGFDLLLGEGESDILVDSSETNIDSITLGKVSVCQNSGSIEGDINVGGIVGDMGMEYSLDPEDDVTVHVDGSTRRKYEVKAIVQRCKNTGEINAKRNYVGGIVGKMDLGLLVQCESYGNISSESGNYVGGIAGICGSTIRHCFSKCCLSGGKYVGGIVGAGVQKDKTGDNSTVAGCYAIVTIADYKQYAGAISGTYAGVFLENYFVSEDLAGIDRMSYQGHAEALSYDELINSFAGKTSTDAQDTAVGVSVVLPDEFKKFNLTFVVEGEVVSSDIFDYGASFGPEKFPELPQKEGYYAHWDRTTLENLKFDTTVTAVYEPYISALPSDDVRKEDRAIFFVEGDFGDDDRLEITAMTVTPGAFDLSDGLWDAFVKGLKDWEIHSEVVEQWKLRIPDDGADRHTIRYLPPDGGEEQMKVYLLTDGKWVPVETEVIGSYLTFSVEGSEADVAIVSCHTGWRSWVIVVILALLLLGITIRLIAMTAKSRKKNPQAIPVATTEAHPESVEFKEKKQKRKSARGLANCKKRIWLAVVLAGVVCIVAWFLLPDLITAKGAYETLQSYVENEALAMELCAQVTIGESQVPITARLERTTLNGQRVTSISENGATLYYSDHAVFLENGNGYQCSAAFPDYSRLLEQTMELYQHVELEAVHDTYTITARDADARAILEILLPSVADVLSDTDSIIVDLITDNGALSRIQFSGSGTLNDRAQNSYMVDAVLTVLEEKPAGELPAAVSEAIMTKDYDSENELSETLYRLASGWLDINARDPLSAELTISADCGPLVLDEQLQLYRWRVEEMPVYSIQENHFGLYFSEDRICDSSGNDVPVTSTSNTGTVKLLDILYTTCMNGTAACSISGDQYLYTLSLDAEGMKNLADAVAPEAEKLNITFDSGSICVVMEGTEILGVDVTITGNLQIALTKVNANIGAKLTFSGDDESAQLPEAVKKALQK